MKVGMVIGGLLLVAMSVFMLFSYQPEILSFLVLGAGVYMLMRSKKERDLTPVLKKQATQTILASLLCIVLGLLVGYIVLLIINPEGAWNALSTIIVVVVALVLILVNLIPRLTEKKANKEEE